MSEPVGQMSATTGGVQPTGVLEPMTLRAAAADVRATLRVLVPAGVLVGVLVGGVGSRLAMLVLRLTSPDRVIGVESDDGFEIGVVTLQSFNLVFLGAGVGIIGAGLFLLVRPWLIGPGWFRHLTTALGCGAVVGSILINPHGVDFSVLEPTWLAATLFVAIPTLFGALIGPALALAERPGSWLTTSRWRWALMLPVLWFPLVVIVLAFVTLLIAGWWPLRRLRLADALQRNVVTSTVVRGAWLAIAVLGLGALISDITALT